MPLNSWILLCLHSSSAERTETRYLDGVVSNCIMGLLFERGNLMVYHALQALQLFQRLDLASKWLIAHVRHIKILTWLQGSLVIFLYLVWFSLGKFFFFLGIRRQWSREKLAILTLKPRSHVRILEKSNVGYWRCGIFISVAPTACVPSCGPNAFCQENGGPVPACVCNLGFHGDGFNCSGSCQLKPPFPSILLAISCCFAIFPSTKEYDTFILLKNNNNSQQVTFSLAHNIV